MRLVRGEAVNLGYSRKSITMSKYARAQVAYRYQFPDYPLLSKRAGIPVPTYIKYERETGYYNPGTWVVDHTQVGLYTPTQYIPNGTNYSYVP